jgi:hypothetical protein
MRIVVLVLSLLLLPAVAHAQKVHYPGSVITSAGTLTQTPYYFVVLTQFEQGIARGGFEALTQVKFASNLDLNRDVTLGVGARYTRARGTKMIRGTAYYVREVDRAHSTVNVIPRGVVASIDMWMGWGRSPQRPANRTKD